MPLVTDPKILEALEGNAATPGAQATPAAPAGLRPIEDPELLQRLEAKEPAPNAQAEHSAQGGHGMARNFAAGANEGIAGFIGAPVDAANAVLSGVDRAWNWATGSDGRHLSSEHPVGGSKSLKAGMGAAGIDTDSVEASTPAERIARGTGAGVSGMVLPAGAARAALNAGVGAGSAVLGPVLEGIAGPLPAGSTVPAAIGNMATGAGVGAGAGAGGQFVEEVAPHPTVTVGGETVDLSPLTRFGGELIGGGVVGAGASAAGGMTRAAARAVERGAEPLTQAGREAAVARTLRENAANPDGLAGRIEEGAAEIVPGSTPTTAQASGDAGLLAMERGVSRRDPAAFLERQAEQNTARTAALDELAPEGNAAAVGETFKRTLAQIQTDADAQVARAAEQRATALDDLGGTRAPEQYGADLRGVLESTKAAEKAAVGKLYAAVDPDGTLAMDITPLKQAAQQIVADLPKAAALNPAEARLYDVVRSMPDVERFGELGGLRSELTAAIRAERFTGGETPALRRMSQMLSAVDDTIGRTMAPQEGATASRAAAAPNGAPGMPEAAQRAPEGQGAAPAVGSAVYDRSGQSYPVTYRVVEGDALRPAAGEFQPRDRSRATSSAQIDDIARRLQPRRLGASAELGTGAPMITPDGMVLDGNGRWTGIMRAHDAQGPASQSYRDFISQQFPEAADMRRPVLVKQLDTPLPAQQMQRLAIEANTPAGMALSATEKAAADAGRLSPEALTLYRGGDIGDAGNRDFVRAFLRGLPKEEMNALVTADGRLSTEGAQRIRTALGRTAYGDNGLIASLAETGDERIRSFGGALLDAAPGWSQLRADIAAGRVRPEMDVTPAVLEAARIVQAARARGVPLADMLAQRDAFSAADPMAETVLRAAYGDGLAGRINRGRLSDAVRFYADEARQQTTEARLFADMGDVAPPDIMNLARTRYGAGAETPGVAAGAAGDGKGSGAGGAEARGLGADPARPEAAGAGRGAQGDPRVLPQGPVEPNVDPAAIGQYRDANTAYRNFADRFKGGPVATALQTDRQGAYRVADSDVAARFFHGGKSSLEDVNAFARAVGDNQGAAATLIDYAASDLRRFAVKPDGSLDARRWRTWMDRNFQALKGLDQLTGSAELRSRFQKLADAQQMVDSMGEARTRSIAEFQDSAARFFLDTDPVKAVEGALRSKDPAAAFADLSRRVAQDPEAAAGLRRAVLDHMQARLRGNAEAGDTGLPLWKSDAFQTYVRQNAPALRQVFTADQMKAMEAVAADLQRANRSVAGSKVPGGSDTAQNVAALASLPGGSILWRLIGGAGMAGSGAYGGAIAGGPVGAVAGAAIGGLAQLGREIGMRRINDLLTEAMLNPSLAAQLLRKATPQEEPQLLAQLTRRLTSTGFLAAGNVATSDPIPTTRPAIRQQAAAAPVNRGPTPATAPAPSTSPQGAALDPLAQALAGRVQPQPSADPRMLANALRASR